MAKITHVVLVMCMVVGLLGYVGGGWWLVVDG
jgi:hypothetical protein